MEPLTYGRIEEATRSAMNTLESNQEEYTAALDASATAEADFKGAFAEARLNYRSECLETATKYTQDSVDDEATSTTIELRRTWLAAHAVSESKKARSYAIQERLATLRSLMVSHRAVAE